MGRIFLILLVCLCPAAAQVYDPFLGQIVKRQTAAGGGVGGSFNLTTVAQVVCVDAAGVVSECQSETSPSIRKNALGSTSTDGLVLENTTAAAAGAQEQPGRIRFRGHGWKTDATAASQAVDWKIELVPVQGAAAPQARLDFGYAINGGSYTTAMSVLNGNVGINTASPDRLLHAELADSVTNAVSYVSRLSHITSGTAAAGFGAGLEFELENASGTNRVAATIENAYAVATNAAEDGYLSLKVIKAGTLAENLRVDMNGFKVFTGTEGTCDADNRGRVVFVAGGGGVADTWRVCSKDAGDAYAFRTLI